MKRIIGSRGFYRKAKQQQGIVLVITLFVLVAMTLVMSALIRSTDTTLAAVGNLSLRQEAEAPVNFAIEQTINNLAPWLAWQRNPDGSSPVLANPLYFHVIDSDDKRGIPARIRGATPTGVLEQAFTPFTLYAVAELMCVGTGTVNVGAVLTEANCMLATPSRRADVRTVMDGETGLSRPISGGGVVPIRVTVRVDGPKNTTIYAQSFLY